MSPHQTPRVRDHGHAKRGRERAGARPPGRICAHPACATRLSVYNRSDRCALHERIDGHQRKLQALRPQLLTRTCARPACGQVFETTSAQRLYCSSRCRTAAYYERLAREGKVS